ncbi:hypothetical protein M885DRAFT_561492 [Pelagophyceae sp. CCMP2097]|nr:hypothetical protein M885DRAFT_561492 [Pelagophyceae sp. CCMP2097]
MDDVRKAEDGRVGGSAELDASAAEAQRLLKSLYLGTPGDRETVILLMRGMPAPVTFGFPNTDGSVCSNFCAFVEQFHPMVSCAKAHPIHPFSRKERFFVFACTVAFNFLLTRLTPVFYSVHHWRNNAAIRIQGYLIKYGLTILYAVLIRQLVICPCAWSPLLRADLDAAVEDDAETVVGWCRRVRRLKSRGDVALVLVFAVHFCLVCVVVASYYGVGLPPFYFWRQIFISEGLNFLGWFVRFIPIFLCFYASHRAIWFQGGTTCDYVTCQRSCAYGAYAQSPHFRDAAFPRCVNPETTHVDAAQLKTRRARVFQCLTATGLFQCRADHRLSTFHDG